MDGYHRIFGGPCHDVGKDLLFQLAKTSEPQPTLPHPIPYIKEEPMHVVLGASGNTGHIVAQNLLARQQKVRVVGRNVANLHAHAAQGAEVFIADVTDAAALTKALQNSDVKNVVALSSIGADKSQGTGPVIGLYKLEQKLNQLGGANVLFLRA